jgi:hypothetical protein
VTTPPSKGLVVELYLIYFGLAQSFAKKHDPLASDPREQLLAKRYGFGRSSFFVEQGVVCSLYRPKQPERLLFSECDQQQHYR